MDSDQPTLRKWKVILEKDKRDNPLFVEGNREREKTISLTKLYQSPRDLVNEP